jgi:hypothetical protein
MIRDTAVDDGDSDSRARPTVGVSDVGIDRHRGIVERAAQLMVSGDIHHLGILRQSLKRADRDGVVSALHNLQDLFQNAALFAHGLMVPLGGVGLELNDDIDGGFRMDASQFGRDFRRRPCKRPGCNNRKDQTSSSDSSSRHLVSGRDMHA